MKRHIRQCETTWQRAALVSPPQHLELQDASLSPSEARATELVLLRFLRLSVFHAAADMLRNVRCPPPLVETGLSSWPTEDDIDGAATNVCRLQSAYGLTAAEVVATFCSPVLCNQLSSDDALWLGVHCSRSEPSAAAAWVKLGEDRRYADFFDYNLWELESSTPKWNSTSWKAVVSRPPETAAMWPYRDAFLGNERYSFPSDTRFGVLCRDSRESDARPSSRRSRCWLSSGKRGAATLSPFTVEELSPSEPRLWLVHDFLSHEECESLRREATELEPALVTEENGRDDEPDTRTAALAWLENNGSALRVYQRASVLTGLTMESAEKLQSLRKSSSHFLRRATNGLVYFKHVTINFPNTWPKSSARRLSSSLFEKGDVRIDLPAESQEQEQPFTKQEKLCGKSEECIKATPTFLAELNDSTSKILGNSGYVSAA
ncbi:hypothetical protein MRX96_048522 [Rhipicephalus microplus]